LARMSDFAETWTLIRGRFDAEVSGLSAAQLNWRLHPDSLTLGEMALHVAGVEISFTHQLTGAPLDAFTTKLKAAATDGSVNDKPFPFAVAEITPDAVQQALALGREVVTPLITNLTPELRARRLISALGPEIDGTGAFARLAYHPGYHQGQAYLIKTAPGFPA